MEKVTQPIRQFFATRQALTHFLLNFTLINAAVFWLINLKYLSIISASGTLFQTSFYSYHSIAAKFVVCLFLFFSYIGHFTLLAFLPLLIIIPIYLFCRNKILISLCSILCWSISIIGLLSDQIVFTTFHFHLNPDLLRLVANKEYGLVNFIELSNKEIMLIAIMITSVILVETIIATLIWKKKYIYLGINKLRYIFPSLFLCLFLSYLASILTIARDNNVFAQQTPVLPLYTDILSLLIPLKNSHYFINVYSETRFGQPVYPSTPLHYPLKPLVCHVKKKPLNVVMIGIDSWRYDALNPSLTPHLSAIAKNAWKFNQHYSGGNSTQPGLFSLFYGLPSNYWPSMTKEKKGPLLLHELINHHYQAKVFFSSNMIPPFYKNAFLEIKNLRTTYPPGETIPDHDRYITGEFIEFANHRDKNKPFFAFLLYDAVHSYYLDQNFSEKLYPTPDEGGQRLLSLNREAQLQEAIYRYRNAVHFVDGEIGKIWNYLKTQHLLENTLVMITSDHGEELGDNWQKYWGHGSNYTKYQTQVPLIIYEPQAAPKNIADRTTHYDIAPYLLQRLLACQNPNQDYSIGENLLAKHYRAYVLAGSYLNMGIIEKNSATTLLTSGHIQIQDNQANLLYTAKPNLPIVAQALADMRRYYQ